MAFDLAKEIKDRKLVFGAREALKEMKKGNIEAIYISADCHSEDLIGKTDVKQLDLTSSEMKEICKKPFRVSVIALVNEEGKGKEEKAEAEEKKPKRGRKKKEKTKEKEQ